MMFISNLADASRVSTLRRTWAMASQIKPVIVNLFHPYNLRTHDNPILLHNSKLPSSSANAISLYIKDPDWEKGIDINPSFISSAVNNLRSNLQNGLTVLEGKYTSVLPTFMKSILDECKNGEQISVVYSRSSLSPYASDFSEIQQILSRMNIQSIQLDDHLTSKIQPSADVVYSKSHRSYHQDINIPKPIVNRDELRHLMKGSSTQLATGESRALQLLEEYIELGDHMFCLKYADECINNFATSTELKLSMHRLVTPSTSRSHTKRISFFPGEVFSAIMSPYLTMGCISPRMLYWARSSLVHGIKGVTRDCPLYCRIRDEAIRRDWHQKVADIPQSPHIHHSYWRGYIQREYHPIIHDPSKPSIILIHGFGGSLSQNVGLMEAISSTFNCYAIDMIGFGYSEKPPLSYNQYIWRDQVVDYVNKISEELDVDANRDVYIGGNSIGGFTAAAVAAKLSNHTDIQIAGLILMNCAGVIHSPDDKLVNIRSRLNDTSSLFPPYKGLPPLASQAIGKVIFTLLQPNIQRICEWLYPTNPGIVSKGLAQAIYRDSCDIGASDVIASGAKIPPPRSMNSLLHEYVGPVLIAQGILDPMIDAKSQAYLYEKIRDSIAIDLLQLGHCPMDENPKIVASSILSWIKNIDIKSSTSRAKSSSVIKS